MLKDKHNRPLVQIKCPACNKDWTPDKSQWKTGRIKSCCGNKKTQFIKGQVPFNKKEDGEASCRKVYNMYKWHSKKRNHAFELDYSEFKKLTSSNCHYCGCPPCRIAKNTSKASGYVYNGIDRKENNVGYTAENVVTCCWQCNNMKSDLDYSDFLAHVKLIAGRLSGGS